MYTLIIFIGLLGFYMLYHTSLKMKSRRESGFSQWIASNPKIAKPVAIFLMLAASAALLLKDGIGAGFFTAGLLLMASAAIIITFDPLRYLKNSYVFVIFAGCILLETVIFN